MIPPLVSTLQSGGFANLAVRTFLVRTQGTLFGAEGEGIVTAAFAARPDVIGGHIGGSDGIRM